MHSRNKHLVLSLMMVLGIMQPMHAGLAAAADTSATPQSASLSQATAQPQASANTLAQATENAKPSTVALAIREDQGVRFFMTTPFTSEEIDKYPGYEQAFASHAVSRLESENPQDVAAISHLVHKYPEIAGLLAVEAVNRTGRINESIKKALATSKRPPIMTLDRAGKLAYDKVFGIGDLREFGIKSDVPLVYSTGLIYSAVWNARNNYPLLQQREALIARGVPADTWNNDLSFKGQLKEIPKVVANGIATAAITHLALREFDERVGDLLPCPKYDPKSRNITRYSCMCAKWALRNIVVPAVISQGLDKAASTVKDSL